MTRDTQAPLAPKPLATPTDLTKEQVTAVTETVNPLIADALALYIKTKNFHWHLSGRRFRDLHLLFDEQADTLLESIDTLAERVRKLGGSTLKSLGHASRLTQIADDDREFVGPQDMVKTLLEDNRKIAVAQRRAIDICDDNKDTPTGNILQELLDETERRIWFLFEITQDDQ
jgi:starvation-inducible DNA-binding protein